jgi:hypothetical protein
MRSESVGGFIKKYSLASEVMQSYGVMFDHKDRDKLNNLEANLRPCNKAQNAINTDKRVGLSSKYKGVTFDKATGRGKAQIGYNNNIVHLGRFDSQELAAQARDKKAVELFGDFAVLNIPESFQLFAGA